MSLAIKARKILNLFRSRDFQYPTNDSNNEYSTDKTKVVYTANHGFRDVWKFRNALNTYKHYRLYIYIEIDFLWVPSTGVSEEKVNSSHAGEQKSRMIRVYIESQQIIVESPGNHVQSTMLSSVQQENTQHAPYNQERTHYHTHLQNFPHKSEVIHPSTPRVAVAASFELLFCQGRLAP